MQSQKRCQGLGVGLMRRVGPQPPEPDWDRLDFRGLNGTRQAWGHISPSDEVIVTNEGDVFVKIERANLTVKSGEGAKVHLPTSMNQILKLTFRWVNIIKRMYVFVDENEEKGAEKETVKQKVAPSKEPSDERLHLKRWQT
jgi:hypothetical protein